MAKNDHLLKYTEAAMALLGGRMPDVVYMPPDIRESKRRVSADGLVTEAEYGEQEIIKRIAAADPIGLLIAIMNGQPIPGFRVRNKGEGRPPTISRQRQTKVQNVPDAAVKVGESDGAEIYVEYYTPSLSHRERVAQYLTANIMPIKRAATGKQKKPAPAPDDYAAIVARRAAQAAGQQEPDDVHSGSDQEE